jgi:hypothetical protein
MSALVTGPTISCSPDRQKGPVLRLSFSDVYWTVQGGLTEGEVSVRLTSFIPTSLSQLLLKLKLNFPFLQNNLS